MPHTNRRKIKQPSKRVEVTDDEGWTRITTTKSQHREQRARHRAPLIPDSFQTTIESGATVGKLLEEYRKIKLQWQASDSFKTLSNLLASRALRDDLHIDKCFMFGSGSFCGLRMGWISRQSVALCQLAVLESMASAVEAKTTIRPALYVQEPAYNDLDVEFLQKLGISVVQDPAGFELVDGQSLVYSPCAELEVELAVLKQMPSVYLTSKMDWVWRNAMGLPYTNRVRSSAEGDSAMADPPGGHTVEEACRTVEDFMVNRESARLPSLDTKDNPFTDQYLYWPSDRDGVENDQPADAIE